MVDSSLSASKLTCFQRCKRRFRLEQLYRPVRWSPKLLFTACLRQAVLDLSAGINKAQVAQSACTRFRSVAADPGLDTMVDPWTLAGDFCAMLQTVIEALSRQTLLTVKAGPTVTVAGIPWRLAAFVDETGELHRWQTVNILDADALARELHSWYCFGDIAAAGVPMTLHIVEIGRQRVGHQVSPWCRAFKHPAIANHFRFQSKTGKRLEGGWKPIWFADGADNDPVIWVDLMEQDQLRLIHHIQAQQPDQGHIEAFRVQFAQEAESMAACQVQDPMSLPMSRPACDAPGAPCPWQTCCFAPVGVDIEALGGYRRVEELP